MLAHLAKLASISIALRKDAMEKKAIVGVLGTLAGKAALTAASHPIAALTAVTAVAGAKGKYNENMSRFKSSATGAGPQQVPYPPGVGS